MAAAKTHRIGVISDTHGLIRPEALKALGGSDLIIHAGDIGSPAVIEALRAIAPVTAIRGNNDRDRWASRYPETAIVEAGAVRIYVIHDLNELAIDPASSGFALVVSGHSHKPSISRRSGVLYLNPGSAGPRRFTLPIALARATVRGARLTTRLITLRLPPKK